MNKALVLVFLVSGILAKAPVPEKIDDEGDAEVDQALQPFWDLLLAKVTMFSETWSQRIKEVMRSLAYPKGHHHKCADHQHHHAYRMGEDANLEDISAPFRGGEAMIQDAFEEESPEGQPENTQGEDE